MPSKEQILADVGAILATEFEIERDRIVPGAHLIDDLDFDSIDAIDLAVRVEQKTGQAFDEEELTSLATVQDVVDLIYTKLESASALGG